MGTWEDGDLHRWTRVDVLPPDGMQEVSGSSPLSSTGQKHNSNGSNSECSSKVRQRRPGGPPYVCLGRASSPDSGCRQDSGFQAMNQRWTACHLAKPPPHRSGDSCHVVITRSAWRAVSAGDCCRLCKWPSRAGRHGGPVGSQGPRLPARAARVRWPWARRVAPMVSVRRWARLSAAPLSARLRRGAALCACPRAAAPHEEPSAARRTRPGRVPAARSPTQGCDAGDARSSPPPMAGWAARRRGARTVPEPSPPVA